MLRFFFIILLTLLYCPSVLATTLPAELRPTRYLEVIAGLRPKRLPEIFTEKMTGMSLVKINGSCFDMGSPLTEKGRGKDEGPVHEVCVDDFWLGRYEVTNAEFRMFKADQDSHKFNGDDLNGDQQPVVYVSWQDATAYAAWLSSKSGRKFRLPTEAEWEFAARAKTLTTHYWDSDSGDACVYANVGDKSAKKNWQSWSFHPCDDGYAASAPVGSFKPNAFGLYDMLGNVWEWTNDRYAATYGDRSSKKKPPGPATGKY
ncbi:MAG: formylglycine-generating enzyme family protein, partial [Geopsychrobacter sp.]|nr:formylglycine-generating enzyme family protein [Geopsychrobacter sp.]